MELPERTSNLLRIPIPFPIVKEAGNGGYAIVFEVRDPQTGKKYALKKMDMTKLSKSNFENVVKEIRSQTGIRHPYIVELLDHMKDGNLVYLLLSYAENGNLFTYMNKVDIGHAAACRIFVQLCLAIEFIHSKGYIHRDIKPENIFLDRDMNVLLGDFGWCCHVSDTTYRYQKAGTYEYMSPEALNGKLQGREVDIWALGVLLYELFHNQEPFPGRSSQEVLSSIQKKTVEFFSDVPKEAKDLIVKILTIDPKKRPGIRDILNHEFIKKYYHDQLPPPPQGVENYPQSPTSSRNTSPIKNQIHGGNNGQGFSFKLSAQVAETIKAGSSNPASYSFTRAATLGAISEAGKTSYTPRVDENKERSILRLIGRQNTTESLNTPPVINSQRFILETPQSKDPRTQLGIHSLRDVKSSLSPQERPLIPNAQGIVIKPQPVIQITGNSKDIVQDQSSPQRNAQVTLRGSTSIMGLPSFPLPSNKLPEVENLKTDQSRGGISPSDSRSAAHQYTPAMSHNAIKPPSFPVNQPDFSSPPVELKNDRFQIGTTKPNQTGSVTISSRPSNQYMGSPRILINYQKENNSPETRSPSKTFSPSVTSISPDRFAIGSTRMAEYNLKDLKPVDRTFERDPSKGNLIQVTPVSALTAQNNPGTPLVIGQQYRPQIVSMNTNPVRKTVPIIPTNQPAHMSTDKSPADAPQTDRIIGNNPPPTSYPLTVSPSFQWKPNSTYDAVFRGFNNQPTQPTQPSTTPVEIRGNPSNPMQRDQTNFDSSMIKTTGSSSTDESRRIIIEPIQLDGRITPDVSAARHSGLNNDSIGRSSNGNPAMPLSRDDPHNLNPPADKKVFLKRRTSDGFMSSGSGSSPAKDSNGISSPLRNILRVNNGRSSGERAEPSRYFFTNTVHNESMGSPLLRPSPIKTDMNNTGSYASFFMKKITSIDSNISSEMDPLPVSIAPMKYMGTTQQVASPPSPDLARAMTAVVVTSNQAPRQAISSTMTNALGSYHPASINQMKKNEIISPMTVPEGPKPIYTIYSGIPSNNQLNENRSRIHQEYGAPQQGMIRVSSHVNHSISATPSVIRGSYSHLTSKPEGGFSLPPTNYNLSANTYIHHK